MLFHALDKRDLAIKHYKTVLLLSNALPIEDMPLIAKIGIVLVRLSNGEMPSREPRLPSSTANASNSPTKSRSSTPAKSVNAQQSKQLLANTVDVVPLDQLVEEVAAECRASKSCQLKIAGELNAAVTRNGIVKAK